MPRLRKFTQQITGDGTQLVVVTLITLFFLIWFAVINMQLFGYLSPKENCDDISNHFDNFLSVRGGREGRRGEEGGGGRGEEDQGAKDVEDDEEEGRGGRGGRGEEGRKGEEDAEFVSASSSVHCSRLRHPSR